MMEPVGDKAESPKGVYAILILVALSVVAGRIANVVSREGDTPFLSANDRSRWCTIASLVETGSYEIDPYLKIQGAKANRRPWATIDLVRHQGKDGELHFYSSKPPLLPTIIAGIYWLLNQTLGMWLSDHPIYLGRIILCLVNLPTLAVFYVCTISAIDRVISDRWARCYLAAATCFGTMLMPFAISLSNHLPAAASASLVLYVFMRSIAKPTGFFWWLLAGLGGGFLAANELPALSMTVGWAAIFLLVHLRALPGYLIGVAIIAASFFGTNWLAHQSWRPPYAHRSDGEVIAKLPAFEEESVRSALKEASIVRSNSTIKIEESRHPNRKRITVDGKRLVALVANEDTSVYELRVWDDWYDYPGSYWVDGKRRGVDKGEASRQRYLVNMTLGHYGVFSLTPIWILVPFGLVFGLAIGPAKQRLMLATFGAATAVCAAFYVMRPEIDRNYGGVSICFRWMLWFAPLWLFMCARPVAWLSCRPLGRWILGALLACSVASMAVSLTSPWQSPWLYRFWEFLGWIKP